MMNALGLGLALVFAFSGVALIAIQRRYRLKSLGSATPARDQRQSPSLILDPSSVRDNQPSRPGTIAIGEAQDYGDIADELRAARQDLSYFLNVALADNHKLGDRVVVVENRAHVAMWSDVHGGTINFVYTLFNGSLLELKAGHQVAGAATIGGGIFHDDPIPQATPTTIAHGDRKEVVVQQHVLAETVAKYNQQAIEKGRTTVEFGAPTLVIESIIPQLGLGSPASISVEPVTYKLWIDPRGNPEWERL